MAGLYSGIKFSLAEDSFSAAAARSGSDKGSAPGDNADASTSKAPAPTPAPALASAGFSAALKFAPRLNKSKPAPKPPIGAGTTFNAGVLEKQATVFRRDGSAPSVESSGVKAQDVQLGTDGRPLASAPSMTIAHAQEKRPKRDREEERKRQKKKKKRKQQQQLMANFNPDEPYDPSRPNDLGEYQQYRKRLRAERKAKYMEEKRRREAGESSGSSYYTDSEDEAPRRDAPKLFAPPQEYSTARNVASIPPPQGRPPSPPRRDPPPPAPAAAQPSSGEDAYARRQAMAMVQSGDDAYARRLAMSQGRPPAPDQSHVPAPPPSQPILATPPAQPPTIVSPFPPSHHAGPMPPFAPASQTGTAPTPTIASSSMPPFPPTGAPPMPPFPPAAAASSAPPPILPPFAPTGSAPQLPPFPPQVPPAMPPYAPSTVASSVGLQSGAPGADDFAAALEEKKRAAAAIAAKFSNLAPAKPAPPKMEDLTGTFAEKMMKKWGHVEGTGIGARGDGLVQALTTEHVAKPTDPNKPLSKRQLAKQRVAAANAKKRKWVQAPSARGRIVDAGADAKAQEERDKLGDASRIVCLVGMVESEEDVDEEMPEEIGEECSKFGIVERVVLHMVEPPPPVASDCLRVFVVFSGMAGAWRCIKEMDGRFFGGRKIKATYFPEARFDAGDRDGALL